MRWIFSSEEFTADRVGLNSTLLFRSRTRLEESKYVVKTSESKVAHVGVFGWNNFAFLYFCSLHFGDCFVKVLLMKRRGAFLASRSFSQKERKKVANHIVAIIMTSGYGTDCRKTLEKSINL